MYRDTTQHYCTYHKCSSHNVVWIIVAAGNLGYIIYLDLIDLSKLISLYVPKITDMTCLPET